MLKKVLDTEYNLKLFQILNTFCSVVNSVLIFTQNISKTVGTWPFLGWSFCGQCGGSGMFISDPGSEFFHPGFQVQDQKNSRIPDPHQSIFTQRIVSTLWEI
jgi:hypothetical protein